MLLLKLGAGLLKAPILRARKALSEKLPGKLFSHDVEERQGEVTAELAMIDSALANEKKKTCRVPTEPIGFKGIQDALRNMISVQRSSRGKVNKL